MSNSYKYMAVKKSLIEQIHLGQLKPEDKLLSEAEYAQTYQVSAITIRKALSELAAEGYITRVRKKGTFVSSTLSTPKAASQLIAIVISAEQRFDISHMKIIKGIQSQAAKYNYSVIVEWCENSIQQEAETIKKLFGQNVAGFIIYPFDPLKSRTNFELIEKKSIPYVLIDRHDITQPGYFVGCDNFSGAYMATSELLKLKHSKIKFAAYNFFLPSEQERFDGFFCAMRQSGLYLKEDSLLLQVDLASLKEQIISQEVTALFCCNDRLAIKIIQGLNEYGIHIPQDLSIIGFDDWDELHNLSIGLSTIKQDFYEIGSLSCHLLLSVIDGSISSSNTKLLSGVTLVRRNSAAVNPHI